MLIKVGRFQVNLSMQKNANHPYMWSRGGMGSYYDPMKDKKGQALSVQAFYMAYGASADISSCITEVQKWTGKGGYAYNDPKTGEEVNDNFKVELDKMFNSAHSTNSTFKDFRNQMIFGRMLTGNAYAFIITDLMRTKVLGLQVIDPRTISIVSDKYGTVYRYIQHVVGGEPIILQPEQVVHWKKGSHPNNPLFGMTNLEPAMWEVKTDLSSMISNYKFFENNAIPAAQYIMDETLSEEEIKKAVEFMKNQHGGAENRHKTTALMGIKEIKQLQLSNKDIEFIAGRKLSRQKVCSVFGVPEFLLGYTESVNNNNGAELFRKFIDGTIQGEEDDFESFINDQLFVRLGINDIVEYVVKKQQVEKEFDIIKSALDEYVKGAITLRTYKTKTGQEITPEDEKNEMIDKYIIQQGASEILLEDVGSQDFEAAKNAEAINALIQNDV